MSIRGALLVALLSAASLPSAARAAGGPPVPAENGAAEQRYNDGLALAGKQDWPAAEAAYRESLRLRPDLAEAWNGLGHALRKQKKYDASVRAYKQALHLRPDYPQALEYLGETYVAMGKLDEARAVLAQLRPLDATQAATLERVIGGGASAW